MKLGKPHITKNIIGERNLSIFIDLKIESLLIDSTSFKGSEEKAVNTYGVKHRVMMHTEIDSEVRNTKVS